MAGECKRCQCDPIGSASQQCHRNNGTCTCLLGSGGALCNECARGYTGRWPHCEACGECYRNWDDIIQKLKSQVASLIGKVMFVWHEHSCFYTCYVIIYGLSISLFACLEHV
uniref:Laminin EGF-like domain-containing protein n=1 Tax=Parascaris equorum TaxID=6256 RepID=A0A914R467_PAREQ